MPTGIGIGSAGQVFGKPLSLSRECDAQYCVEFDGITEMAYSAPPWSFGTDDFTISIWFKTPDVTGGGAQQDLFGTYAFDPATTSQFQIGLDATGKVFFASNLTGWTHTFTAFTPVNDTWTHIVYSIDRSGNAVWYGDVTTTSSLDISANTINLTNASAYTGLAGGLSVNKFEGRLADIAQWNKALTATEVQEYYDNTIGSPKMCANTALSTASTLQGWWRMYNPSGTYEVKLKNEGVGEISSGVAYDLSTINMNASNVITDYPS